MEIETLLRVAAVVIAGGLLVSNFNYLSIVNYMQKVFSKKPQVKIDKEVQFLDVVESWHVLKSQCIELDLTQAVEKLDEVFPLLNVESYHV